MWEFVSSAAGEKCTCPMNMWPRKKRIKYRMNQVSSDVSLDVEKVVKTLNEYYMRIRYTLNVIIILLKG